MNAISGTILALFCIGGPMLILVVASFSEPSGRNCSRDHNAIHGRWRVRYNDGKLSEPMCKDVAEDYASIFGGTVIPRFTKK
jgi:hypothetical protein